MVLQVVQKVHELVVVRTVARLSSQFVHIRRPAGCFDGRDRHGIDLAGAVLPLLGRCVHDVAFGKCADLGLHGFFLLEEHSADFQVSDARDHGALHDSAAFVVFDVAHPCGFLERDLFRETLLLEISDGVVIRVGKEVLDGGGGFDIVFQMGHEVRTVAFDLLVRRDGAEDDLSKFAGVEGTVCYASHDFQRVFDDGHGEMGAIVD